MRARHIALRHGLVTRRSLVTSVSHPMSYVSPLHRDRSASQHKDIVMSIKTLSLRAGALALFATFAVAATEPALAAPAKTAAVSASATDLSAARRHHQAQRKSVRNAYGAYVGGASAAPAQTWNSYGNGVGDNSRNQTW